MTVMGSTWTNAHPRPTPATVKPSASLVVQLPTLDPAGAPWDAGGGAPDIFVEVLVNGVSAARSAPVDDMFSASFSGPFTVQPIGGGDLTIMVYDEDLTVDDPAYSCAADPLTADLLRSRQLSCNSARGQITFRIDPS
jgi:hypothetical protein